MARGGFSLMAAVVALLVAGCGGDSGSGDPGSTPRATAARDAPNIVVLMTDDQAEGGWELVLPEIARMVGREGMVFENAFVTTPLCCPSRATFLTGQYAHNHGVLENDPGYPALRDPGSVLPEWLRQAGYRTGHAGKWLNGYDRAGSSRGGSAPPPGWDEWYGLVQAKYYDYELSVNGEVEAHRQAPDDHANEVITRYGLRFIRSATAGSRPFFLSLAYVAPHADNARPEAGGECGEAGYAVPAPEDLDRIDRSAAPPRSSAFNERDVSDKPGYVRELPRLGPARVQAERLRLGCERASLAVVDRGASRILGEIRRAGVLADTVVVFTSDHGFLRGEHRIEKGKSLPYDGAVRVPLAIRAPREAKPARISALAANIDLAPTILDYASAEPCLADGSCRELDGRSLRPLIESSDGDWDRPRAVLAESTNRVYGVCSWSSVRTARQLYTQYRVSNGDGCGGREEELYDLERDPAELRNVAADPRRASRLDRLRAMRGRLSRCTGRSCR